MTYLFFDTETTGVPRDYNAPMTNVDNLATDDSIVVHPLPRRRHRHHAVQFIDQTKWMDDAETEILEQRERERQNDDE